MPGFSTEDFGALLNTTRFNNNKKQQSMDAHEALGEKRNTEERKETKHHSKRRSLENLQDCTGHMKTNTEGVMEPKKQRKANNLQNNTRMKMEYFYPIMGPNKKRKKQDTEDDDNQDKESKKDTKDHEKQDRKKKKDTKDYEKREKKSKDTEDHENKDKKNKGEGMKERKKGWNMECCKRIKDCIKKSKKEDNEDYEEQGKKRSTEKRDSQAKKRKGKSVEDRDSQAKKKKKQDKEEHDTRAKKKIQDNKEHDGQAKKRKRQDKEDHDIQAKKKKKRQDKEEHDTQAKKRKRQDKEEHDTQAKKRKRQDKEEYDTQGNKRKGEEKEPKKRRPLERILDHLRKRRGRGSNEVLTLKVEAERVKEKRSVSKYCRVHLEEGHMKDATVRGHPCLVFFDTGASASIMFVSLARRAGLVTGREKTEKILFSTWNGILLLDVIMLPEVLVVLKDGIAVNTPMLVFPKEAEVSSHNDVIVLSMSRLQEAEMQQEFHSDGSSTLFLRHPERLQRRPQPGRGGKVFAFAAQAPGIEEPLTVLLDTCSSIPFSITMIGRDKVGCRTGSETPLPTRAMLQFGSGTLTLQMNTNQGVSDFDFVFGRPLLCQLRAAIHYVHSTMTLKLNRKQFRLGIFPH